MKKLKLFFIYNESQTMAKWFHCTAVFENGWVLATHICSHPSFAPIDLWGRREERHAVLKEMGIEVEPVQDLINDDDLPNQYPWLLEVNRACDQEWWSAKYIDAERRLEQKEDSRFAKIGLEFTDDTDGNGKPE